MSLDLQIKVPVYHGRYSFHACKAQFFRPICRVYFFKLYELAQYGVDTVHVIMFFDLVVIGVLDGHPLMY